MSTSNDGASGPGEEKQQWLTLASRLGHRFDDITLLRDALTHRSLANERPALAPTDNERLEFLGDAVLGALVSSLLVRHFPDASEGELTRRRANLVCERGLAIVARELNLGAALRLGHGEVQSGGRDKPRLLASAFEACVAAIYLDGGHASVAHMAEALLLPHLVSPETAEIHDAKSRLQEWAQQRSLPAPCYRLVKTEGPEHDRRFFVELALDDVVRGAGSGKSKASAEQTAAREALTALESLADCEDGS